MKRFILNLFIVVLVALGLLGGLVRLTYVVEFSALKAELSIPTNQVAVVVGDSHVEVLFDDGELPWLRNFGLSGMPFEATAKKAKLLVECNPHLQLMVIDIWPTEFFMPNQPFGPGAPYGVALFEMYDREDMPPMGDDFIVRLAHGVVNPGLSRLVLGKGQNQLLGGFKPRNESLMNNKWGNAETYESLEKFNLEREPAHMEKVLENLIVWMQEHKVNLVLTTTPLYRTYREHGYTPEANGYFISRMEAIAKKHKVPWLNWLYEYQDNPECWADGNHLNSLGVKAFLRDHGPTLKSFLTKAD